MSVESARAYINRMRTDEAFRSLMNEGSDDEEGSWARIREAGYDFDMQDFRKAQEKIYEEYGIEPM